MTQAPAQGFDMGMVGLGVMGRNLAYNMADHGVSVAAFDAWPDPVARFEKEGAGKAIGGFGDMAAFCRALKTPRRIILLVKAGAVTDQTIDALSTHLEPGDMLIDGGNEHFTATERRAQTLSAKGIRFFGMGVSGGEEGARHGPSMMPGGDREAYEALRPVLEKIAAKTPDGPCVTYCGPGGAGHYVKMVHNGIEYGDMQLIAEAYAMLKLLGGFGNTQIADTFDAWNQGELASFLVEITARIFRVKDDLGAGDLIDAVLDATAQKGTGKWTVNDASELGASIPTIASSVDARLLSSQWQSRKSYSQILAGPELAKPKLSKDEQQALADAVKAALYCSKLASYAQGFSLMGAASRARNWNLQFAEIARIWQAGCIIRAGFLGHVRAAYLRNPELESLLIDAEFTEELSARQSAWRKTLARAMEAGIPVLTSAASLAYYDSLRTERLPANLTQAQRDLFGAHTYKRLDREGDFHSPWLAQK
jgi:6-phosphogluconate dehydrogenase